MSPHFVFLKIFQEKAAYTKTLLKTKYKMNIETRKQVVKILKK